MLDGTVQNVATRYLVARATLTLETLAKQLELQLGPPFKELDFTVYVENLIGEKFLAVQFFQAPKGSERTTRWNAKKSIKISISGFNNGDSDEPPKLLAETSRSRGVKKFRKTQGPADKVIKAVVSWFKKNTADLTKVD